MRIKTVALRYQRELQLKGLSTSGGSWPNHK
jgi:hypothetical protein